MYTRPVVHEQKAHGPPVSVGTVINKKWLLFKAYRSHFSPNNDGFLVLTIHSGTYISKSGDFVLMMTGSIILYYTLCAVTRGLVAS